MSIDNALYKSAFCQRGSLVPVAINFAVGTVFVALNMILRLYQGFVIPVARTIKEQAALLIERLVYKLNVFIYNRWDCSLPSAIRLRTFF